MCGSILSTGTSCHGSALGDGKSPAATHATTYATTPATALLIVAIGRHDLSFEAHSIQDLEALADTESLRDIRTASVHGTAAERCELVGGSLARRVSGLAPGPELDGAMRSYRLHGRNSLVVELSGVASGTRCEEVRR